MVAFADTNILVYALAEGPKYLTAQSILGNGCLISVQSLNELVSVLRGKLRKPWDEVDTAIDAVIAACGAPRPLTITTHLLAKQIARDHKFHIYDAMVIASAIEAGCNTLYSEDIHAGWTLAGLTVVNPFG